MNKLYVTEGLKGNTISFLRDFVNIEEHMKKPSFANQGQALDGISALANFRSLVPQATELLKQFDKLVSPRYRDEKFTDDVDPDSRSKE